MEFLLPVLEQLLILLAITALLFTLFRLAKMFRKILCLTFNINYLDGSYLDFQVIDVIANPTYATQAGNDVALTITSKGTFAFNDFPGNSQGDGFKYLDGPNHLYEGALILATSPTQVSDAARGPLQGFWTKHGFHDCSAVRP